MITVLSVDIGLVVVETLRHLVGNQYLYLWDYRDGYVLSVEVSMVLL